MVGTVREGKGRHLKVGSVVIDCNDFDTMSGFWQEALRYVPRGG